MHNYLTYKHASAILFEIIVKLIVRLHRILFIFKDINLPKITLTVDLAPTYVKKKRI